MGNISQFISNHWQLSVAFVIISILIFINEMLNAKKQGKSISPEQAVDLINNENALVVDLRDQVAFKSGHIISSIRASESDFDTAKMHKYKNKTIILVCNRGIQATNLAQKLKKQEYINPMVLSGGIDAWKAANLPLTKK